MSKLADDDIWFAVHLDRSHRMRGALPDEFDLRSKVIVRRLEPGFYRRVSFDFPVAVPDVDEILQVIFDIIVEAIEAGRSEMPGDELGRQVHSRIYAMAHAGTA